MAGIPYAINVDDPTSPADNYDAKQGAGEFRALKGKVNGLIGGTILGFKDRLINGDMRIDQLLEYTSANLVAGTPLMAADTWWCLKATAGATVTIQNQAASLPSAGLQRAIVYNCTVASAPAAADANAIYSSIEGLNIQDLQWGTANAKTVTLGFWVKGTLIGTYGLQIQNSAANRSYVSTYSINVANTWEYKTIIIPGDTAGVWATDNTAGLTLILDQGSGNNYETATTNAWQAGNYRRTSACIKTVNNVATVYLTGVQLEVGSVATGFDFRDYASELIRCQRYYEKSYNIGTLPAAATTVGAIDSCARASGAATTGGCQVSFKVTKRATPTIATWSTAGTASKWSYNGTEYTNSTFAIGDSGAAIFTSAGAGFVANNAVEVSGQWTADARL